jgi:hypothetical protein
MILALAVRVTTGRYRKLELLCLVTDRDSHNDMGILLRKLDRRTSPLCDLVLWF